MYLVFYNKIKRKSIINYITSPTFVNHFQIMISDFCILNQQITICYVVMCNIFIEMCASIIANVNLLSLLTPDNIENFNYYFFPSDNSE